MWIQSRTSSTRQLILRVVLILSLILSGCRRQNLDNAVPTRLGKGDTEISEEVNSFGYVSSQGIGPIEIGMTVEEAEVASGLDLASYAENQPISCTYLHSIDDFPEVRIKIAEGHIVQVEVIRFVPKIISDTVTPTIETVDVSSQLTTPEGIGINTTESQVLKLYPDIEVVEDPQAPGQRYLVLEQERNDDLRLVFETEAGRVVRMSGGLISEAEILQQCL